MCNPPGTNCYHQCGLNPKRQQIAEARQILVVNRKGVGSVDHQMVDEAVARKARLVLERAGITDEK